MPEAYETIVISLLDKIIVIVKAPVFIGTCFNGQRKSVGYSDFFGRVFFGMLLFLTKIYFYILSENGRLLILPLSNLYKY